MTTSRSPRPHPLAPSAAATPGTLATTTASATAGVGTARSGGSSAAPGAALPYHRLAHLTRAS
ncbi:MAG: hypothetical protein Q4G40_11180, partial [Brachybacterium sp.]|nr:hypothetical protein [Brachybacterium sp.]